MKIVLGFPGGVAVDATFKGHTIHTDQPLPAGADSAHSPFDLFLASVATCMGFYALRFCQERSLSTEGLALTVETTRDPESKLVTRMDAELTLPEGFPEKYHAAIQRAIDHCTVKQHLAHPPEIVLHVNAEAAATI